MIINPAATTRSNVTTASPDSGTEKRQAAAVQANATADTSDRLSLSDAARQIIGLVITTSGHPEPDPLRIAELKQQVNTGTFTIDDASLASRLRQFTLNLQQES